MPITVNPSIASGAKTPVEFQKNCKNPPFHTSERKKWEA
jgi:hypothetical protein